MVAVTVKRVFKFYFLLWCVLTAFVIFVKRSRYSYNVNEVIGKEQINISYKEAIDSDFNFSSLKYILVWTDPRIDPIMHLGEGIESFMERNCSTTNCYATSDRRYFDNITKFDSVVFHGPNIIFKDLPKLRSPNQKYIFASMESSDIYPMCNNTLNHFFNWTWTYKVDSDEMYGYISIKNKEKKIIGPKKVMHWIKAKEMQPIGDELKNKLSSKKYAAAWFVSHCNTKSKRENVAMQLASELRVYNLTIDVYGICGTKVCKRSHMKTCLAMLESDYYFYLAFENSLSEDYVTEKLLYALNHYTVPIVYGAANYTRFMPDNIYLDAGKIPITELAFLMASLIEDKEAYYNYFKWHNHYSYHDVAESPDTDSYCKLCAMLNDKERFKSLSMYPNFTKWWNSKHKC